MERHYSDILSAYGVGPDSIALYYEPASRNAPRFVLLWEFWRTVSNGTGIEDGEKECSIRLTVFESWHTYLAGADID